LLPYKNNHYIYLKTEKDKIIKIPNLISAYALLNEWYNYFYSREMQSKNLIYEKVPLTKLFSITFEVIESLDKAYFLKIKEEILKYFQAEVLW
jgi:hypothetical protein